MFRRLVCLSICLLLLSQAPARADDDVLVVVELFTSQGCSSCPPADQFLGELAGLPDILALSEHVDYWDYLGWRDPFASRENTERQRAYARRLGVNYVYTPQIVVQGATQVAGTERPAVLRFIEEARGQPRIGVELSRLSGDALVVRLEQALPSAPLPADVWLVRYDTVLMTKVARGENIGRQAQNYNVVRGLSRLASWNGEATSVPIAEAPGNPGQALAVIVQESDYGRILGAARLQASLP